MAKSSFEDDLSINITPLIDIIFILLLFFILTATFDIRAERSIDINLPDAISGKMVDVDKVFRVFVNDKNELLLNRSIVTFKEFENNLEALSKENKKIDIYLAADAKASHGTVVKILDAFRGFGFFNVNIEVNE